MLSFLIYVLGMLLLFAGIFGLTMAYIRRIEENNFLKYILGVCTGIGFLAGIAIYVAKRLQPKKLLRALTALNRQVIVAAWMIASVALIIFIVFLLLRAFSSAGKTENGSLLSSKPGAGGCRVGNVLLYVALICFSLSLIPLMAHILPQLYLKTGEFVAFNEESVSTGTLFRFGGYALGWLLAFLTCLSIYQAFRRLNTDSMLFVGGLFYVLLILDLAVRGISSGARLGILPRRNSFVFEVMIFEDKSMPYFAVGYLLIALIAAIIVYLLHRSLKGEFQTSAMRRKAAWWQRNCRRWAKSLAVFMLLSCLMLTVVNDYITRPVELAPAEAYQEENGRIIIPLSAVEDGHLHRFAYMYEKHNIRFIVVRKPGSNAYGVGLDACEICGIAGYFERGNSVVCKRCDVVMNKATIGFKGGCNPVPFPYEVKDGRIIINKSDLEKEANRFPVGA